MANELTVTKDQAARFVHDAVEMETAIFTVDRAIEACEKQRQQIVQDAQQELNSAEDEVKNLPNIDEYYRKAKSSAYTNDFSLLAFGGVFLGVWIGCVVIASVIIQLLLSSPDTFSAHGTAISLSGAACGLVIAIIVAIIKTSSADKQAEEWAQAACNGQKYTAKRAKDRLSAAKHNYSVAKSKAALIGSQINDLRNKRSQIQSTLSHFYGLNIIPPDYRYMDCAIMLDQIFRNDLADTMRDAIKIYEERVFRGEVIKGMDKICRMLGQLSVGMAVIGQRINAIDSNVKMMSQDLYNFSAKIEAGQKANAELLNETKMSRYAAEQVAESAKNLEWHERRRQGWV